MDIELQQARRICEAVGPSETTTELWVAAVEMNDGLSRYRRLERKLHTLATEAGVTEETWLAVKSGR